MTKVFEVKGGHVVGFWNGELEQFVGVDGYWVREKRHATPFETYKDARSVASWLEGTNG